MTALQFLINLRPAIPMSRERPCTHTSNAELKRWLKDGSVLINGERFAPDEAVGPVLSLVFFPKSKSRTTLV